MEMGLIGEQDFPRINFLSINEFTHFVGKFQALLSIS